MRVSDDGVNLIKYFEGLRLVAYEDAVGVWTIGYGHTGNVWDGMTIEPDQAEHLLRADLIHFENGVERALRHEPKQNQFDAMVSLAYNIGVRNFTRASVLYFFNRKKHDEAAESFMLWNKIRVNGRLEVYDVLTRRRKREKRLFATGVYNNAA